MNSSEFIQGPGGVAPTVWFEKVFKSNQCSFLQKYATNLVSRYDLINFASDDDCCDLQLYAAVMAWGKAQRGGYENYRAAYENHKNLFVDLRGGVFDRRTAYDEFITRHNENNLKGVGPGYFTKLIYFFSPSHDGYIMDTFSATGLNVLYQRNLVEVKRTPNYKNKNKFERMVDASNDGDSYENYCLEIEKLASTLAIEPEEIEVRLYSEGLNKVWRNYSIQEWDRLRGL
ncbi:MAG: hypothetical protein ABJM29_10645 [Rhizobiaceae bacterium]